MLTVNVQVGFSSSLYSVWVLRSSAAKRPTFFFRTSIKSYAVNCNIFIFVVSRCEVFKRLLLQELDSPMMRSPSTVLCNDRLSQIVSWQTVKQCHSKQSTFFRRCTWAASEQTRSNYLCALTLLCEPVSLQLQLNWCRSSCYLCLIIISLSYLYRPLLFGVLLSQRHGIGTGHGHFIQSWCQLEMLM